MKMPDSVEGWQELLTWIVVSVGGTVGGMLGLRKLSASSSAEVKRSGAEGWAYDMLRERLDKANAQIDELSRERNALMSELGSLRERCAMQDRLIEEHRAQIAHHADKIRALERAMGTRIETKPGELT